MNQNDVEMPSMAFVSYPSRLLPMEKVCLDSARDLLRREILSYKDLSEGWDGDDGRPPLEQTLDDAVRFIDQIPENSDQFRVPLPIPSLGGDGELVLYWRFKRSYAEASFLGDGVFSFYSAINRKKVYCPGDQDIPESVNGEMRKIASVLIHVEHASHELS